MEFALAEGYGKAPIAFVEQDVPENEIPLITKNVQPKKKFSRGQLEAPSNWPVIQNELKDLEQQALATRRLHFGLPNATIEEFYLKLCKLLLTATRVSIINHSLLPLGSTFDQDDTSACVFPEHSHAVSARDLYFTFESALVTENSNRLKCLLTKKPAVWTSDFVSSMLNRVDIWAKDVNREFVLERAISVPVWGQFSELGEQSKNDIRQRYLSIFRSLGRMEKRQAEAEASGSRLRIQYTIRAFKTATLQSFPTTVHMVHDNNKETAVWGFLRSSQTEDVRTDDFLVAHNCNMVSVWKKQVETYFENESLHPEAEKHSINLVEKGAWQATAVESACRSLTQMIGNDTLIKELVNDLASFHQPGAGFKKWLDQSNHT
ncbi:MAG: hypothetical protein HYR55_17110 [Acidobacteria bacterium]|nr:hypothetical protein [Acidobacteriota bacterium]MBI3655495.1 hypothetical protein [Acidobacteriota bacterium]